MKFLDEYRDGDLAQQFAREIHRITTKPWTIMEVCGGQTHAIVKFGIDELLPKQITLIHGPGCPVCVTPLEIIDKALEIAATPERHLYFVWRHVARAGQYDGFAVVKAQGRRCADCLFAARCGEARGAKPHEGSRVLRRGL
jgi:hydrogenase expression/formation protein HypD